MSRAADIAAIAMLAGAGLALAGCGKAPPQPRDTRSVPAGFSLASASITLPEERLVLPATPAGDLLTQNCTGCHSAEMLTAQPPLDKAKWQAEIDKMRTVFHAPVDSRDDSALIAALGALPAQAKR